MVDAAWPDDPRIIIVGASCAGLSAAEALRERGYRRVTILEARARPGGQSHSPSTPSAAGDPVTYEAGTVWSIPSPVLTRLRRRYGLVEPALRRAPIEYLDVDGGPRLFAPHRALVDGIGGTLANLRASGRLVRELRRLTRRRGDGGLAQVVAEGEPELFGGAREWFEAKGCGRLFDILFPIVGNTLSGGYVADVPAIYYIQTLMLLLRYSARTLARLDLPYAEGGHAELWRRVAAEHDVRYGAAVRAVRRAEEIEVETTHDVHRGDVLLWAAPLDRFATIADADSDEEAAFSGIRTFSRSVVTCEVRGIDRYVMVQLRGLAAADPRGLPYSVYEVQPGVGIYNFYSFLRYPGSERSRSGAEVRRGIDALVRRLGAEVVDVRSEANWGSFFPHFDRERLMGGALQRIEALQGRRRTFFAGELLAHITVPLNAEYAEQLVARFFPAG